MGTQIVHRRPVKWYEITKIKKISKDDEKTERFNKLSDARKRGIQLLRNNNFVSLKNSNGISLTV